MKLQALISICVILWMMTLFITAQTSIDTMNVRSVDSSIFFNAADDASEPVISYNGFFVLGSTRYGAHYHYWFFPREENIVAGGDEPFVVWFNGGPGCSSIVGVMLENGPFQFDIQREELNREQLNPSRWSKFANMLYIDSPLGAGFSHYNGTVNDIPNTAQATMEDIYLCLQLFFKNEQFRGYRENRLYLSGESYGAKYVLHLGSIIDRENEKGNDGSVHLNLHGLMMFNGWVYSEIQHRVYIEYAYLNGMIDYKYYVEANTQMQHCMQLFANQQYEQAARNCSSLYFGILDGGDRLPNSFYVYDVRRMGSFPESAFTNFMNKDEIKKTLGTELLQFSTCGAGLFPHFGIDFHMNDAPLIPKLLSKYQILLLNGQFDIRSSVFGVNELVKQVEWNGKYTFDQMPLDSIQLNGTISASFKSHNNLTLLTLYGAGHMAPMDQPQATFNVVKLFIDGDSLCSATKAGKCNTVSSCPQQCSKQGQCTAQLKCKCNSGFSGEICNEGHKQVDLGEVALYPGYIFGKQMNTYNIQIASRKTSGSYDLSVTIERSSKLAKLHMFVHTGTSSIPVNKAQSELLKQTFAYKVFEDASTYSATIRQLPLLNNTHITIVVMNTVDTEANFKLTVTTQLNSGNKYNTALIGSVFSFGALAVISVFLALIIVAQFSLDSSCLRAVSVEVGSSRSNDGRLFEQVQEQVQDEMYESDENPDQIQDSSDDL